MLRMQTWRCVPGLDFPAGSIISADWTPCVIVLARSWVAMSTSSKRRPRARLRQVIERDGVRAF